MAEQGNQDDRDGISAFLIHVDVATLRRSASGSITGTIYVDLERAFPDQGWSDFVVVILGWWLRAIGRLRDGAGSEELSFMDGPYKLRVWTSDGQWYAVEGLRNDAKSVVISTGQATLEQLAFETHRAASRVIDACSAHCWRSPDIDVLSELVNQSGPTRRRISD